MVNSPAISLAYSASGWSSPGAAHPPRIPHRSLLTIPTDVVEHAHTVLGATCSCRLLVVRSRSRSSDPPALPLDIDARSTGSGAAPGTSLITTSPTPAGPSTPERTSTASQPAQN